MPAHGKIKKILFSFKQKFYVRNIRTDTRSIRITDRMSERQPGVSGHIPGVSGSTYITRYCLIAIFLKKLSNLSKKLPKFGMT